MIKFNSTAEIINAQQDIVNIYADMCAYIRHKVLNKIDGKVIKLPLHYFEPVSIEYVRPGRIHHTGDCGCRFKVKLKGNAIKFKQTVPLPKPAFYNSWNETLTIDVEAADDGILMKNIILVTRSELSYLMERNNVDKDFIEEFEKRYILEQ